MSPELHHDDNSGKVLAWVFLIAGGICFAACMYNYGMAWITLNRALATPTSVPIATPTVSHSGGNTTYIPYSTGGVSSSITITGGQGGSN